MRVIDTLAWRAVTRWLEGYSRRNPGVRHCFIRHSTASGAQNLLLSDHDLAFFVDATNIDEFRRQTLRIHGDLKKYRVFDSIVLPATPTAYRLCAAHYVQRSRYPMDHWRRIHGEPLALPACPYRPPPLDHAPESFLFSYLLPAVRGAARRHPFEAAFLRRKLAPGGKPVDGVRPTKSASGLFGAIVHEIRAWDIFYGAVNLPSSNQAIKVISPETDICQPVVERWNRSLGHSKGWPSVDSIWVYPGTHDAKNPVVSLNFKASVSAPDCEKSLGSLLRVLNGVEFALLVGTERSMQGRLGGLSRLSLLEPWLVRECGHCLLGNPDLQVRIREPILEELRQKVLEYFLYLSYRVFPRDAYPDTLFRLCFTLDHLFRRHELALDSKKLAALYGSDFQQGAGSKGSYRRHQVLSAWKKFHGLDLFAAK